MSDLRRATFLAVLFLVVLRVAIGWQLLYEGLWKINSQNTSRPWTAEGYLKNAQGPFRSVFRKMTGDPNDLNLLDYDKVIDDWDVWQHRFLTHYPSLTKKQTQRLNLMINGPSAYYSRLEVLPAGVKFGPTLSKAIKFEAPQRRLAVDGERHLTPRERDILLRMVPVEKNPAPENQQKNEIARAFHKAVDEVFKRQARLCFKERLAASLKGDPTRVGTILKEQQGTIDYKRMGEIELYKTLLARYERNLAHAKEAFQFGHLETQRKEISQLRAKLVGPVLALGLELQNEARKLLNRKQLALGPSPSATKPIDRINAMTIWGLTGLGTLLILGLSTRFAALAAAGMLLSFYLAMPPWPGIVEFQTSGPEHSFLVNKNLIEVFALLAIAALPTGTWFGIDGLLRRLFSTRQKVSSPLSAGSPTEKKSTKNVEVKSEGAAASPSG